MNRMLRKSRFIHVFEDLGILWHSLSKTRLGIDPSLVPYFLNPQELLISEWQKIFGKKFDVLANQKFLVEEGYDEKMLEEAKRMISVQQIQGLYLMLTTACNLDCSYCLYRANSSQSLKEIRNMNIDVMHGGLALFSQETSENDRSAINYWEQITLYGGEPLLNPECLRSAILRIGQLKKERHIWEEACTVINTNGTLINENFAEFAVQHEIEVQISIDGSQETHDQKRRTRQGNGSFRAVLSGLSFLSKARANFVPMITLHSSNLEKYPALIEWLCWRYGIRRYYTNLLMATTEEDDPQYPEKAAKAMLEANKIAKEFGACDENFTGTLASFSQPQISKQSCGAGRKLTVFPDGKIHACQALEKSGLTIIGHLPRVNQDSANWKEWTTRTRFAIDECIDCPILGSCGGGCAAGSYHANGSIKAIDPHHCRWIKALFKQWMLNEL